MVDININWGDVRNGSTEAVAEILKPLIEQGFNRVEGWAILNLDTCINTLGIDMYRGKEKLKVKLFSPSKIRTAKGDVYTPNDFWCTSIDRMERLQDKCEMYDVEAKLNCPVLDDELFVECDGRVGSAKSSFTGAWYGEEHEMSLFDAVILGCDRNGNSNLSR